MKAGGIEGEGHAFALLEQVLGVIHLAIDQVFRKLKVVILLENPADVFSAIIKVLCDFRDRIKRMEVTVNVFSQCAYVFGDISDAIAVHIGVISNQVKKLGHIAVNQQRRIVFIRAQDRFQFFQQIVKFCAVLRPDVMEGYMLF